MRDRTRTARPPVLPAAVRRRGVVTRIRKGFWSVIGWLRAGYPDEAPATGYSRLLALHGPIALTPRQIDHIIGDLADITGIGVAITKTTDRLPTENQIRTAVRLLGKNPGFWTQPETGRRYSSP